MQLSAILVLLPATLALATPQRRDAVSDIENFRQQLSDACGGAGSAIGAAADQASGEARESLSSAGEGLGQNCQNIAESLASVISVLKSNGETFQDGEEQNSDRFD